MHPGLKTLPILILFQDRFGMPYSFCLNAKAASEPTNPPKGSELGSVDMAPVYLGHEHGLVNGTTSGCGGGCGGGCAGGGCSGGCGELAFHVHWFPSL